MSDLTAVSAQDLRDIEKAADLAARSTNNMSETFSRFCSLERRARAELARRRNLK